MGFNSSQTTPYFVYLSEGLIDDKSSHTSRHTFPDRKKKKLQKQVGKACAELSFCHLSKHHFISEGLRLYIVHQNLAANTSEKVSVNEIQHTFSCSDTLLSNTASGYISFIISVSIIRTQCMTAKDCHLSFHNDMFHFGQQKGYVM